MKNPKILIVEDNIYFAGRLALDLKKNGFTITDCARTKDSAIDSLVHNFPDLVLLDYELKGNGTGVEVAQFIQKNCPVPIIYLTQYESKKVYREIQVTDYDCFLPKLPENHFLLSAINKALEAFQKQKHITNNYFLNIINDNKEVTIKTDEILWINTEPNTKGIFIATSEKERKYNPKTSIIKIEKKIDCSYLVKIRSSHILNLDKVIRIESKTTFYIAPEYVPKLMWDRKNNDEHIDRVEGEEIKFTLGRTYLTQKNIIYQKWLARKNYLALSKK